MIHYSEEKCKSGLHREWSIEEGIIHYFGCLKFDDRDAFFNELRDDDKLKEAIVKEKSRISRLRGKFEREGSKTDYGKLLSSFKAARSLLSLKSSRRPPGPPPTATATRPQVSVYSKVLSIPITWMSHD